MNKKNIMIKKVHDDLSESPKIKISVAVHSGLTGHNSGLQLGPLNQSEMTNEGEQ